MSKPPHDLSDATRLRLIEAAGPAFAEHGFKAATVRDICARAEANVAAVNYHFGGKEGLYLAVLRHAHTCAVGDAAALAASATSPEDRLRLFIRGFVTNLFCEGKPAWYSRLMTREMSDPTGALDELVQQDFRPRCTLLHGIVRELLGPAASDEQVDCCGRSVMGQMTFYYHARPVIERLFPNVDYSSAGVTRIAEHIARFSLAALKGMKD